MGEPIRTPPPPRQARSWPRHSRCVPLAITCLGLGLSACPQPGAPCESSSDCLDDEVCVERICRTVCNASSDCPDDLSCRNGACMQAVDAGVIDAAKLDGAPRDGGPGDRASADSTRADGTRNDDAVVDGQVAADSQVAADGGAQPDSAPTTDASPPDSSGVDTFSALPADWWHPNWKCRVRVAVSAGDLTEDLTAVPVPVRLDDSTFDYGSTQDTGQDIRAGDLSGTQTPSEVEEWDETGTSVVWTTVPSVTVGSTDNAVYLYYGNPTVTLGSTQVFGPTATTVSGTWTRP